MDRRSGNPNVVWGFINSRRSESCFYLPHISQGHICHLLTQCAFLLPTVGKSWTFTLASLSPQSSPTPLSTFYSLQHCAQATDLTWSRPREQGTVRAPAIGECASAASIDREQEANGNAIIKKSAFLNPWTNPVSGLSSYTSRYILYLFNS